MKADIWFDATIIRVYGGYSSAAERLTVAQDVEGSIPSSRPNKPLPIRSFTNNAKRYRPACRSSLLEQILNVICPFLKLFSIGSRFRRLCPARLGVTNLLP